MIAAAGAFGLDPVVTRALREFFDSRVGIERIWIYGSRARGEEHARSDVDLAIDAPRLDARAFAAIERALSDLMLVRKVELVHLQRIEDESFRAQVERDRKLFWQSRRLAVQASEPQSIELKEFQEQALARLSEYVDELARQRERAAHVQELKASEPDIEVPDFARKAWEGLAALGKLPPASVGRSYSGRLDGVGRPIPNVCLKVPTGGGKTLLAASAIGALHSRYYRRHHGLVLWIVPNEAIFRQTKKSLTNRDHPYRQMLNVAGAGKVKLLEKDSPLSRIDVESHLCVMLLMLQSAARQSKETLRFFRDRGNVHGFFPREDDLDAHWRLLGSIPNLSVYAPDGNSDEQAARQKGSVIKDSLGNVMRLMSPMVVIDEGHHAYTDTALKTIDGFNPSFVLELSATPRIAKREGDHGANILVDVRGTDLERAEMIKLPINVDVRPWPDWQSCLSASFSKLEELERNARALEADTARYIRPILLVQVERTGSDQVESGLIHSEHAKTFLLQLGLHERQIAIKTSEKDDLAQPENQHLLSPTNEVRAIVTKQALQEGWDCPFAYVLCALAAGRNQGALTQLVGRILRQPHAAKTGRASLDECYVYCHDARTADVVSGIKKSLESEGMGDLVTAVRLGAGTDARRARQAIGRRKEFAGMRIFLPKVAWLEHSGRRELAYESDVLGSVDWNQLTADGLAVGWRPSAERSQAQQLRIGLDVLATGSGSQIFARDATEAAMDRVFLARAIGDLVPNAWRAYALVDDVVKRLRSQGHPDARIAASAALLVEQLRTDIEVQRDALAEAVFFDHVRAGRVEFRLRADRLDYEIPQEMLVDLPERPRIVTRPDGHALDRSLFEPVFESMLDNDFEGEFACYLDARSALTWWHRNVAKSGYGLQGWRKNKVYPDFVFAKAERGGRAILVVLETKGLFLNNEDTDYKQRLLEALTAAYGNAELARGGELELVGGDSTRIVCDLVFDENWRNTLNRRYFDVETV